ncbi:MAG TPA: nucleoside/nucleotide kinase family protein [Paracoccaceae bacterium]|nr:nucleoside/nucleotide kinase family protein [Paracoccaceae bacterium]
MTPAALADLIRERAAQSARARFILALAGPPGAGKSTLSAALLAHLGQGARVVPMDGFHYDDAVLAARGLSRRKGAPETFDTGGFLHLMARLRGDEPEVAIPVFDRTLELSRAAADVVTRADQILIVEGNYLLLDEDPWRGLAPFFDLTVFLDVPEAELDHRLVARWAHHGRDAQAARDWIDGNDLPNARRVTHGSRPADLTLQG